VRVDLPDEVEVLIANLMDCKIYEADLFKELSHGVLKKIINA